MIVILSLNTAIDRLEVLPGFVPGGVFRAERTLVYPAGKGLNVARVVRQLGEPVRVVGFLGGAVSPWIEAQCTDLGIETRWVTTAQESRTCILLVDPDTGTQTVVNEPGPEVTQHELDDLCAAVRETLEPGDILCLTGSGPPGAPVTLYGDLARSAAAAGVRALIDARGESLGAALAAHPWSATPNIEEARSVLGDDLTPEEMVRALGQSTEEALLTMGERGVLYRTGGVTWRFQPPSVRTVNAVGSGDAFTAGYLAGTARTLPPRHAVRLGVACGASNAARLELGVDPRQVELLAHEVTEQRDQE